MFPPDSGLETQFTFEAKSDPLSEDLPFHILLLGNWSRDGNTDFLTTRPIEIDRDNFDEVMSKSFVQLNLDIDGDNQNLLSLTFNDLDDFHPDSIFRRVSLFSELRDLRRRLLNENTFTEAAAEIRLMFDENQIPQTNFPEQASSQTQIADLDSENLLDDILSRTIDKTSPQTSVSVELNNFLNSVVKPFVIKTDENEQAKLLNIIDDATSDLMRLILHHPEFQELESAWRGVFLLVRRIETDVNLKIFLLDLSKDQLISNLKNNNNLTDTDMYKFLVKDTTETPGGIPWTVVFGNYSFDLNIEDVAALIRISRLSEIANAPFITHILPDILESSTLVSVAGISDVTNVENSNKTKLWTMLRSVPEAGFLGAITPRFLARLPYGKDTDPTETFSFEEFKSISEHENYLWANPSFICAIVLAKTFQKFGWEMNQNFQLSLDGLPTHIYQEDGETKIKPCAEVLMTEKICQKLLDEGFMPLISFKNTDRVQLGIIQSISLSAKNLNAKWT